MSLEELLEHYRRHRRWTRELAAAIPADHLEWAPSADAFTCLGLVRHLMQSEVFWRRLIAAAARGEAYDPFGLPGAPVERLIAFRPGNLRSSGNLKYGASVAECLARWDEIQAETERELASIPADRVQAQVEHPLTGVRMPLWEAVLVFLEHEAHHRGQLSAYLKALGAPHPQLFT